MCAHLRFRVPFFRDKPKELILTLVDKLECRTFEKG